jgi:uncharacterized damage-inducible protein DinB
MNLMAVFDHEFQRHRRLMEQAIQQLNDEQFFHRPSKEVNSIALIVKHLAGNLTSRWTDFLTSDGEKPSRNRDTEFVRTDEDSRDALMAAWNRAWATVTATLRTLGDDDLERVVTIRGEPHTVLQATLRSVDHVAYHAGQVLYLARMLRPDAPWLTIPPGRSNERRAGGYLQSPRG